MTKAFRAALAALLLCALTSLGVDNAFAQGLSGGISNPRPLTGQTIHDALGYTPARPGANSDITSLGALTTPPQLYKVLPGEWGVVDTSVKWGWSSRYGILPDGNTTATNWANTLYPDAWVAASQLPGVRGYLEPGYYKSAISNIRAVHSGFSIEFDPQAEVGGLVHLIAKGTGATGTCSFTNGAVSGTTVGASGAGYVSAPKVTVSSTSGLILGFTGTAVMTATAIDTIVAGGTGYAVNDTYTTQGGIVLTVTGIGAGGSIASATISTGGANAGGVPPGYYGRFTQVSTSGTGSAAMFYLTFAVQSVQMPSVSFTGAISTTTLTIPGAVSGGTITTGQTVNGAGITAGTFIVKQLTGTPGGGSGATYQLNNSQTVSSEAMTLGVGYGGTGTCNLQIDPPSLDNWSITGCIRNDARVGVQGYRNGSISCVYSDSNAARNVDGVGSPGGHIDYGDRLRIGDWYQVGVTVQNGNNGWTGLSVDNASGGTTRPPRNVHIDRYHAKQSDINGLALCNGNITVGEVIIEKFGTVTSNTATQYCGGSGANGEAKGVYVYRATGSIGTTRCQNNDGALLDAAVGATAPLAKYCILVASTGQQAGSSVGNPDPDDNRSNAVQFQSRGFNFGTIFCGNVSAGGCLVVGDKNNTDASNGATVSFQRIVAQVSAVSAMATDGGTGYAAVSVNAPQSGVNLRNELMGGSIECLGTGSTLVSTINAPAADCLFSDTGTYLDVGTVRIPYHGAGAKALVHLKGLAKVAIVADQTNNITGMPASSGNPIVWLEGASGKVSVNANSGANNMVQTVLKIDGTSQMSVDFTITNYRGTVVSLLNTNTDLKLSGQAFGVATNGTGMLIAGTLIRPVFRDLYFNNFVTGIDKTATPTITNGVLDNCRAETNTTNTTIANGAFTALTQANNGCTL